MATTCPDGTVTAGTLQNVVTPADISSVMTAVIALIGTLPGLTIRTTGADYLVVSSASAAGRWLFTFGAATTIHTNQRASAQVEAVNGHVYVGYSYNSTDNDITAAWTADANPLDSGEFSGYVALTSVVATDSIAVVTGAVLTADGGEVEAIHLWFRKNSTSAFGGKAGAIWAQNDDDMADAVKVRIYGIISTQGVAMASGALSQAYNYPGYSASADNPVAYVRTPAGAWNTAAKVFSACNPQKALSGSGKKLSGLLPFYNLTTNDYFGHLRNCRITADSIDRTGTEDLAGTPNGYCVGYSSTTAGQAYAFRTGAP